jgi:hypothetical protein
MQGKIGDKIITPALPAADLNSIEQIVAKLEGIKATLLSSNIDVGFWYADMEQLLFRLKQLVEIKKGESLK